MNTNGLKIVILEKIDRKQLKTDASAAMKAAKPSAALVTLVVICILALLEILGLGVQGFFPVFRSMLQTAQSDMTAAVEVLQDFMSQTDDSARAMIGSIIALVLEFLGIVIGTGYSLYILRVLRGKQAGVGDVFDAFGIFLRAIVLNILRSIFVGLWSMIYMVPAMYLASAYPGRIGIQLAALLLLLPAVRAVYAYSQAEFIMIDNRRMSAMRCILMSKVVMMGRKRERFVLDLSLLGRMVLCLVPVLNLWQFPYIMLTRAGYYRKAVNDFRERQQQVGAGTQDTTEQDDTASEEDK